MIHRSVQTQYCLDRLFQHRAGDGSSTPNFDTGKYSASQMYSILLFLIELSNYSYNIVFLLCTKQDADGRSFNGPTDGNDDASSNSSTVAKVVSPLVAFAGLVIIGGVVLSQRRSSKGNLDGNENLMKHTREGFDVETGTVSGNTYRTGVFTEDDGTLEGSVDASEGHLNHTIAQKYLNEMENVVKDLEEVSLGDDGASMTSVSSDVFASVNSCDDRLLDAVRASMTAEVFKPDKLKVYDTSLKPEWASRSKAILTSEASELEGDHLTGIVRPNVSAASNSSFDDPSTKAVSYKKFILSSPSLEDEQNFLEESHESQRSVLFETETNDSCKDDNRNESPIWIKAQLRPVQNATNVPKISLTDSLLSSDDTEPEWMKKFRQMGLERKE